MTIVERAAHAIEHAAMRTDESELRHHMMLAARRYRDHGTTGPISDAGLAALAAISPDPPRCDRDRDTMYVCLDCQARDAARRKQIAEDLPALVAEVGRLRQMVAAVARWRTGLGEVCDAVDAFDAAMSSEGKP